MNPSSVVELLDVALAIKGVSWVLVDYSNIGKSREIEVYLPLPCASFFSACIVSLGTPEDKVPAVNYPD
jgi:hypothetical protein